MDQAKQATFRSVGLHQTRTERQHQQKQLLGEFKDELHTLLMTEFLALNPKVYSIDHQTLNEFNEVKNQEQEKANKYINSGCQRKYKSTTAV